MKSSTIAVSFLLALSAALPQAQITAPLPPALSECEKNLPCVTLHFSNGQAEARWSDGSIAILTVESYDGKTIRMKREDTAGTFAGVKGEYVGSLQDYSFAGKLTWTWPGHGGLSSGTLDWTGTPWATLEPVRVSGDVAQKLERGFGLANSYCVAWYQRARLQGVVEGQLTVAPTGRVIDVKDTVHTMPRTCVGVGDIANVSAWEFSPYLVAGVPAPMRFTVRFDIGSGEIRRSFK
jgi:hypothetical protein